MVWSLHVGERLLSQVCRVSHSSLSHSWNLSHKLIILNLN